MIANKAQTIRYHSERKVDNTPVVNPIVLSQDAGSSEIESKDIVRAVAKRQKEVEEQHEKVPRFTRANKKSPVKKASVQKKASSKPEPVMGPGLSTKRKEELKVREFYYNMNLLEDGGIGKVVHVVEIISSEDVLGIILGVRYKGIQSVEGCKPST
ncbi:hypothetical protein H5410_050419 [Solanum commersonii]|uniref:Uncharacterized protein n=1 Tax=Solanum commersonii TaxID=4109 RepID=A0A9J5WXU0_SOLCO|nr:hypothetical protein H5410_050419 [Solanum commersonii]